MQIRRGDRQSMTTILQRLHWLPVKKRIEFKILVHVHKAIYEGQPVYLASLLNQHTPKRCLRSSSGLLLDVPRINLERFGRRAFACAGPTLWNNLRVNDNHTQFKKLLKTYLSIFHLMCLYCRDILFSDRLPLIFLFYLRCFNGTYMLIEFLSIFRYIFCFVFIFYIISSIFFMYI